MAARLFAEFFAGIGLVRAGLEPGGWHCAYANDVDSKKKQMYEGHFGPSPEYHLGDVWDCGEVIRRLPTGIELATASFPCVDLSIAGHWQGLDGKHSSTFFAFLDVLKAMGNSRPAVVLIENVVGFVKSRGGKDFARACSSIAELGYWLDAFVLDAKWFVPQSRPRIFIVAIRNHLRTHPLFAGSEGLFGGQLSSGAHPLRPAQLTELCDRIDLKTGWVQAALPNPPHRETFLGDVLDAGGELEWWSESDVNHHLELMQAPSRDRLRKLMPLPTVRLGTAFRRTRLGKPRTEVRFDLAGCLRTPKGGSARQIVVRAGKGQIEFRWMTAREYARLQGIPSFQFNVPEQQAMYGFGDAVCVPAIQWIDRWYLSPLFDRTIAASGGLNARPILAG